MSFNNRVSGLDDEVELFEFCICSFKSALFGCSGCTSVDQSIGQSLFREFGASSAQTGYWETPLAHQAKMLPMTMCRSFRRGTQIGGFNDPSSVVKGGTGGLAIAGKLAANRNISVAVVKAGSFYELDNGNGSVIPGLAPLQRVGSLPNDIKPLINWGFVTVPQAVQRPNCHEDSQLIGR